jgi:hypothetical protein
VIAAVAMVRDEADILPAFLAHAAALFDLVLVADHASTDATPAILAGAVAAGLPVVALRVAAEGYWQSAVMGALAREAFARGADWVFPIDADEFLEVPDASALRALLAAQASPVVFWRWRHAVPVADVLEGAAPPGWPAPRWLANPSPAGQGRGKVMLHRRLAERLPGFEIGAGNHSVIGLPPFAKTETGPTIGVLWHLPLRSRAQFLAKLHRDLKAQRGVDGRPIAGMAFSVGIKQHLLDSLLAAPADSALLQRIGLGYWEEGIACLDPAAGRAAPVPLAPPLPMLALPAPAPVAPPPATPLPLPAGTLVAEARLAGAMVEVRPAPPGRQRAEAFEAWLRRRFTPGLRIARFTATRVARWRLSAAGRSGPAPSPPSL